MVRAYILLENSVYRRFVAKKQSEPWKFGLEDNIFVETNSEKLLLLRDFCFLRNGLSLFCLLLYIDEASLVTKKICEPRLHLYTLKVWFTFNISFFTFHPKNKINDVENLKKIWKQVQGPDQNGKIKFKRGNIKTSVLENTKKTEIGNQLWYARFLQFKTSNLRSTRKLTKRCSLCWSGFSGSQKWGFFYF